MKRHHGVLVIVLAAGCVLPTDRSSDLRLTLDAVPAVYVGDTIGLRFHAVDSVATSALRVEDILLASSDPSVLTLTVTGRTSAIVVANRAGTDTITLRLRSAAAPAAFRVITVLDSLSVDSVRATTSPVYIGDTVKVYGVGLDPARAIVTIGGLPAPPVKGSFAPDSAGRVGGPGHLSVLVPAAGPRALVTARRGELSASARTVLTIAQTDRLEPNDAAPRALGALGPDIRYTSLVLEPASAGNPAPRDWYTFTTSAQQDVTLVLRADGSSVDDVSMTYSDTLDAGGNPLPSGWAESVRGNTCRGTTLQGYHDVLDSQVIAIANMPPGTHHVMITSQVPSAVPRLYSLAIEQGYHSQLAQRGGTNANCSIPWIGYSFANQSNEAFGTPRVTLGDPGAVAWFDLPVSATTYFRLYTTEAVDGFGNPVLPGLVQGTMDLFQTSGQLFFHGTLFTGCLPAGDYLLAVSSPDGAVGNFVVWLDPRNTPCP